MLKTFSLLDFAQKHQIIKAHKLADYQSLTNLQLFILLKDKYQLNEQELLNLLANEMDLTFASLSDLTFDPDFKQQFAQEDYASHRFLPVYADENYSYFAVDNPFNPILERLAKQVSLPLKPILIASVELNNFFGVFATKKTELNNLDQLLLTAIVKKASDIHLYKQADGTQVFFRINGQLHAFTKYQADEEMQLIRLLKLQARLEISVVNLPQDGRLSLIKDGHNFDIRVSSLPTVYGEDFVLRLFGSNQDFALDSLGFTNKALTNLKTMLENKSGLILVTGPTGSGKTTTLYTLIKYLQQKQQFNIVSLEDPVEYKLAGVRQSQVNTEIGYTFTTGLRAILRQDPDIILIGEIRDQQTAKIALEAAYTGHLVLSSLHTADIRATLLRLTGLGLDPFLVTQTLRGIVAQKLLPKICPHCQTSIASPRFGTSFTAKGCEHCGFTAVQGRVPISELLNITNPDTAKQPANLTELITKNSFYSFKEDILAKVKTGQISEVDLLTFLPDENEFLC